MYVVDEIAQVEHVVANLVGEVLRVVFFNFATGAPSSKPERPRKLRAPSVSRTTGAPITEMDHCEPAREMTMGLPLARMFRSKVDGQRPSLASPRCRGAPPVCGCFGVASARRPQRRSGPRRRAERGSSCSRSRRATLE